MDVYSSFKELPFFSAMAMEVLSNQASMFSSFLDSWMDLVAEPQFGATLPYLAAQAYLLRTCAKLCRKNSLK